MMQQRRAARRAAALSVVNAPSVPTSPTYSSKRLMNRLSQHSQRDGESSGSSSPDSLYSNGSPTLPDPAFEYDGSEQTQQHDESEYESLMAESAGWQTPAWGTWPEVGGNGADWTPSPSAHSPSGGTIISISPAGSLNGRRGSSVFRSGGTGKTYSEDGRRGSDPSLLGFNLNSPDRRRMLPRSRRRSSVLSIGSAVDPVEDARLRNIASMDMLGRRFSEVVEVAGTPPDQGQQDTFVARRIMSQWSPYTDASEADDDDSEIHTAPYIPTPPIQHTVPVVLSNFPLASVATAPDYADTSSEMLMSQDSFPGSPTSNVRTLPRIPLPPPPRNFATPPPPDQPSTLLRQRSRPTMARAMTNYHFPPRPDVKPTGTAAPRPVLHRSTSTPFFSASSKGKEAAMAFSANLHGAPQLRPTPLGVSPLRASLRRQSMVSEGTESRRGSLADSRRPSLSVQMTDRRLSVVKDRESDLRRLSMDRNLSMEVRRMSVEGRRGSADARRGSGEGRRGSGNGLGMALGGRKMSVEEWQLAEDGEKRIISPRREPRRPSAPAKALPQTVEEKRRESVVSRKSSVVSIGEYGYLAPQIVIDAPAISPELPEVVPRFKRNAPPSIVLPEFSFPLHSPTPSTHSASGGPGSPDAATPRFHPLDSFLGRASPKMPSTPSTLGPLSPSATDDMSVTPKIPTASPRSSIMDRGRPFSPPEFHESFLPRYRGLPSQSPRTSPKEATANLPVSPLDEATRAPSPPARREATRASSPPESRHVVRKAVPKISQEELVVEEKRDKSLRRRRRGAEGQIEAPSSLAREVAHILEVAPLPLSPEPAAVPVVSSAHRRAISTDQSSVGMGRPPAQRQLTLPPLLGPVVEAPNRKSHIVFEESTWRTPAHLQPARHSPSMSPVNSPIPRPQSRAQSVYSPPQSSSPRISIAPSPNPRADAGQFTPYPPAQPPKADKSILKRASVTFSDTTHAIPSGGPSRPSVSRASSFSRFFKSRPQSISGPLPSASAPKPVRPSLRPMSSDASGLGHSWRGGRDE